MQSKKKPKAYGIKTLPKRLQKLVPKPLIDLMNHSVCIFREGTSNFDVIPHRKIVFTTDMSYNDNVNGLIHEVCHFATVPEIRCGILDFGYIYLPDIGYPEPEKNYPAILHEAEVFARERHLATYYGVDPRSIDDIYGSLRPIPGYYNWAKRHPEHPHIEVAKLINRFARMKKCQADITISEVNRRLDLLKKEPWRIRKTRIKIAKNKTSISL